MFRVSDWRKFRDFDSPEFIGFLVSFTLLLTSFNNKSFLVIFLLIGSLYFYIYNKSFLDTILSLLLISLPFETPIRFWEIIVTHPLFIGVSGSGYSIYAGLTLKTVFVITTFLILAFKNNKKYQLTFHHTGSKLLTLFFLTTVINTVIFYIPDTITFHGIYRIWQAILLYFVGQQFAKTSAGQKKILSYILALAIFSGAIGTVQFFNQKPLGLFIELTPSFSESGYDTGIDGPTQNRVSGFISHPVYFGSFVSILIPIILGLLLNFIKHNRKLFTIVTSFCLVLLIISGLGTVSRSVWINLGITFLLFFPQIKHLLFLPNKINFNPKHIPFILIIFSLVLLIGNTVLTRLQSIPLLLNENGNASIRLELVKQSFQMIQKFPLAGVGPNRFTQELVSQNIPQNIYGFIVVVHNTFLIIFTELGIPAGLLFVGFILFNLIDKFGYVTNNSLLWGMWIGLVTFIISSQLHPLFNQDPTFELFMLITGYFSICKIPKS